MSRIAKLIFMIVIASGLTGCKPPSAPPVSKNTRPKIKVTASFYPVADIVRQVGGDRVEVSTILPPGADIHHFSPTMAQIKQLSKAHLVIRMGPNIDPFMDTIMKSVDNQNIKIAWIGNTARQTSAETDSSHHGDHVESSESQAFDPHIWLSLINLENMIVNASRALRLQSPEDSKYIEDRCYKLMYKLRMMNKQAQADRAKWKNTNYIAVHSAFRHLSDEIGLNEVGVFEPKPGLQSSARDLRNLIDGAKDNKAKCVFVSSEEQNKLASTVADDLGLPVYTLDVCAQPMSANDPGIIARMQSNLDIINKAMK